MSTLDGMGKLYIFLGGIALNKELVRELYLNGFNSAEIAKELKVNKAAVNKCIQRNFKEFKEIHIRNRRVLLFHEKEVKRAVNYESKKYISDKSFILKNRSAYRTKKNGDIVLRNDLDCKMPWDMPRRLVNNPM